MDEGAAGEAIPQPRKPASAKTTAPHRWREGPGPTQSNRMPPKIMSPTFSDCRPLHQHRGQGDLSTRAEIAHRMKGCSPQSSSSSSQAILVFLHASEFFSPRHPDRQLRFCTAWIQVLRVLPFRGFLKPWGVRFSGVVGTESSRHELHRIE